MFLICFDIVSGAAIHSFFLRNHDHDLDTTNTSDIAISPTVVISLLKKSIEISLVKYEKSSFHPGSKSNRKDYSKVKMRDPKTIERKFCTNPVPDVLSAIETAKKIVHNILANASNEKVRKLRKGNSNIEKFLECNGVASFLERLGFKYHEKSVTRDEKGNTVEVFTGWSKPIKPNDTAGFEDTLNWLQHMEQKIKELAKNGPLAR